MTYAHTYSGTRTREPSPRELEHGRLARRAAAGGIVLLKNTGTLPLDLSAPVALFGSGASRRSRAGSVRATSTTGPTSPSARA